MLGKHGDGIEWEPEDAGHGAVAYFRSSAKEIGRAAVKAVNTAPRDLAPGSIPADYPLDEQVVPQQVIFPGADGMMIHGQLFVPKSGGAGHPALLFFHGGSRRQMLLGWHFMDAYSYCYGANQYWASKGYVVLSVNYRSGTGYGLKFREAQHYGPAGSSEFNDVTGAAVYLSKRADVDAKRIGVWGPSYGGLLTAMALARASKERGGGDAGARPGKQRDQIRLAWESSPMASMKTWKSPVLLIAGNDDRNVSFSQTVQLAKRYASREWISKN